jgi:hypothetical protein
MREKNIRFIVIKNASTSKFTMAADSTSDYFESRADAIKHAMAQSQAYGGDFFILKIIARVRPKAVEVETITY